MYALPIDPKEKHFVVKDKTLLDCQIKQGLSVIQNQIFATAVSAIAPNETELKTMTFSASRLAELFGIKRDNNFYRRMRNEAQNISMFVNIGEGRDTDLVPLFSTNRYNDGSGTLTLQFDERLAPYLLNLANNQNHCKYLLGDIVKLRTFYSQALFYLGVENARKRGNRFQLPLDELKTILRCDSSYKKFGQFRARVLDPALKKINNHTHLKMEYHEITQSNSRKIVAVSFNVKWETSSQFDLFVISSESGESAYKQMKKRGFDDISIKSVLKNKIFAQYSIPDRYTGRYVKANIDYALKYMQGKPEMELKGYIVSAIRGNWAEYKAPTETTEIPITDDPEEKLKKQINEYRKKCVKKWFSELSDDGRSEHIETFEIMVKDGLYKNVFYEKDITIESIFDINYFRGFIDYLTKELDFCFDNPNDPDFQKIQALQEVCQK